ncbi:MAG TPA: ATP-binding protein [Pyrinomonadaceae bacterium]|nr:ATP-binding protein [Pyrinomonadaceae bacterium]
MICFCLIFGPTCLPPARAERLPVKVYTSADGLGSSYVDYLMRDSRGFMWFCTRDGLSRFDGTRFITYQLGGELAPPGVVGIYETRDGSYWVNTVGGLYRFRSDAVARSDERDDGRAVLNAELVRGRGGIIYEDAAGGTWLASGDKLFRVIETDGKAAFEPVEVGLPARYAGSFEFGCVASSPDGSRWLVATRGVLRQLPDARLIFYAFDPVNGGNVSVLFDDEGRGWLACDNRLYVFRPEPEGAARLTVRRFEPTAVVTPDAAALRMPERPGDLLLFRNRNVLAGQHVRTLFKKSDGHIWLAGDDHLLEFDGRALHLYTSAQGLLPGMWRMAEDAAGNLWIGGVVGLVRLDPHGFVTYGVADGLKTAWLSTIEESPDGKLYITNADYSLSRFDGAGFCTVRPRVPPDARRIWASTQDFISRAGELWVLTAGKLYRFAPSGDFADLARHSPAATYDHRDGLRSDIMFKMFEDGAGGIWLSTHATDPAGDGLARWDRTKDRFDSFSEAHGLPAGKAASAFAEDRAGDLWFGFYEGGLVRYRDGRFTAFGEADGVPAGFITDLYVDHAGRLWLSSFTTGLSRVDDPEAPRPRFVFYTTKDGLASNNVRVITEDLYGNIYLGTARGVDRISPDAARIEHYSVGDGLASDFVTAAHRDRAGVIWFATSNGLSRLVPVAAEQTQTPPVWLGGLRVAGNARPIHALGDSELAGLELAPTDNNLQIDFFGLDFQAGETLRYQYMLDGANSTWSAPTEQRTVTYADLQPGIYRFMVRAVTPDGVRSRAPAVVSFTILRPVWQRWWFVTLALLLAGAAAYALYRYRLTRLLELERVRTRIATDLHDDIGASMSQVAILSEVAKASVGDEGLQLRELLSTIAGSSRETVDAMSDIVWAVNPERDHLRDLTQRMRRFAGDSMSARGIDFNFRGLEDDKDYRLGADVRREVYLIFKETVNNLVRHSGCAGAEVECRVEDGRLVVKVKDDGVGFDVAAVEGGGYEGRGGHGLKNMRRRADGLGGSYEIVSAKGRGTTITLRAPLEGARGLRRLLPRARRRASEVEKSTYLN